MKEGRSLPQQQLCVSEVLLDPAIFRLQLYSRIANYINERKRQCVRMLREHNLIASVRKMVIVV